MLSLSSSCQISSASLVLDWEHLHRSPMTEQLHGNGTNVPTSHPQQWAGAGESQDSFWFVPESSSHPHWTQPISWVHFSLCTVHTQHPSQLSWSSANRPTADVQGHRVHSDIEASPVKGLSIALLQTKPGHNTSSWISYSSYRAWCKDSILVPAEPILSQSPWQVLPTWTSSALQNVIALDN
jgi:hypothetical protein